jgi:4-coumarate--CoA ligase
MSQSNIVVSAFSPFALNEQLSIPEFMTRYNPDDVPNDKVVHIDTITGKSITYGALRQESAKCASGFRKLGLREGDVVSVVLPNSVNDS